jgi:hypothetical protein
MKTKRRTARTSLAVGRQSTTSAVAAPASQARTSARQSTLMGARSPGIETVRSQQMQRRVAAQSSG